MKTLSFNIAYGKPSITGDSSKGTLVETDKHFCIGEASVIDLSSQEKKQEFLNLFLQHNHDYLLEGEVLIIDDLQYIFKRDCITRAIRGKKNGFHIPTRDRKNLFNLYQNFYRFHQNQKQLDVIEVSVNQILNVLDIQKCYGEIRDTIKGFIITVHNISYSSSLIRDFELLLDTNNQLHFLHFFEAEGEYYSNGETPISRDTLEHRMAKAKANLDLHDKYVEFFKNKKIEIK